MQIDCLTDKIVYTLAIINDQNHRKAYINSLQGRAELAAECPPELVAEVLAVWGDTPTMPDAPISAE